MHAPLVIDLKVTLIKKRKEQERTSRFHLRVEWTFAFNFFFFALY